MKLPLPVLPTLTTGSESWESPGRNPSVLQTGFGAAQDVICEHRISKHPRKGDNFTQSHVQASENPGEASRSQTPKNSTPGHPPAQIPHLGTLQLTLDCIKMVNLIFYQLPCAAAGAELKSWLCCRVLGDSSSH